MVACFRKICLIAVMSLFLPTSVFAEAEDMLISRHLESLFDTKDTPFVGIPQGPEVVEFFDYSCSHCRTMHHEVKKLGKTTKIIMKEFPILGPNSELASRLALAAHKQGKYEQMHNELMSLEEEISEKTIQNLATKLSLNLPKLNQDRDSAETTEILIKNRQLAFSLGIMGTPAFVTKNQILSGTRSAEALKKAIDTTVITLSI